MNKPNFTPKNIVSEVKKLTKLGLDAVDIAIKGNTWQDVFTPLDMADLHLARVLNVNAHLNSVMFSDEFNEQYEKTLPIITDYYHKISTNKNLYKAFVRLDNDKLNAQEAHILTDVIRDFELSGMNLVGQKLIKFKDINQKLSLLGNKFAKNSLQATDKWTKKIELSDLGKNYPVELLAKLKKEDGYFLSLQMPVYIDVITYASNKDLREEIYNAYISRASEVGITDKKYDNTAIMNEILSLRQEKSNLLGFDNYCELSLATKMADSANEVVDFLNNLITKVKPIANKELVELTDFAKNNGFCMQDLRPCDIGFYSEKLKNSNYGFNKSDLRPYFPEQKVFNGLFLLIKKLYNIDFIEVFEQTYHKDVKVFELKNNNNFIGKIYLDIYSRGNKKNGAWMSDYQGLSQTEKPIAFVVCNLNSPTKDEPALFEFDEIVTIFHEFGHALHHLLTTVKYPSVAGINGVPWDAVELPSQMMEFFCYEKSTINDMSAHIKTGKTLPNDLYDKLMSSIHFQSAMALIRQCEFALWDIKTHISNENCYQTLNQVRTKTALIPATKNNRFLNTFGHIFSGGYAAGYYSYLWAEVLASDAFLHLKNHNFSPEIIAKFSDNILMVGGSLDFKTQYKKFRGKMPNIDALLKARGLI